MGLSLWQLLVVVVLFIVLFGRGRIPALMTDLAAGIKSFRTGISEDESGSRQSEPAALEAERREQTDAPDVHAKTSST